MLTIEQKEQKNKRPRWHLIYYALAALDLLTVFLGIYLSSQIANVFNESVEESITWANRTQDIVHLSELANDVNQPGNFIFESNDIPTEQKKL